MVSWLLIFALPLTASQAQDPDRASLAVDIAKLPAPTEEQSLALETLNGFRTLHGLEPVTMDRRLNASAALHASTMAGKRTLTHKDDKKETANATERAQLFGYEGAVSELVASGIPDSPYAVVAFMDAPYHRRLLLKPGRFEFGCATESGFSCFVLGGTVQARTVISPPDGAQGVPTYWDGREEPSPMRGTGLKPPYGYPALVSVSGAKDFSVASATFQDGAGKKVDFVLRQPSNDPEARDCAILVPKAPLAGQTTYNLSVTFVAMGESRSEAWSFTTGKAPAPATSKGKRKG